MASIQWAFGVSGFWKDKTRWTGGSVPGAADDVAIEAAGLYTVTLNSAEAANSLTFDAPNATLAQLSSGPLTVAGAFDMEAGTVKLDAANSFGSVDETGGSLLLYEPTALGSADLTLGGGELTGMADETVGNPLTMGGSGFTIDAATGDTVDFGGGDWSLDAGGSPTIQFGSASRKGTVIWSTPFAALSSGAYDVDVAGGVLKAGDSNFEFLLENDSTTTVAAGARIDLAGFSARIDNLQGAGGIVDSGAAAALVLSDGGAFSGAISGPIAVEIGGDTIFTGANNYTGGTTIDAGESLQLQGSGRIAGPVVDNGALFDFDSSSFAPGAIYGTGNLYKDGTGTLALDNASAFSGGATLTGGVTDLGVGSGLGTGAVVLDGGELVATASETLADDITFRDSATVAAATGDTLTMTGDPDWDGTTASLTLTFGDATHKGTVYLKPNLGTIDFSNPAYVKIADGTVKLGDSSASFEFPYVTEFTIASGATLNLAGFDLTAPGLTSAGTITNSSTTTAILSTDGTSSASGLISGRITLDVAGGQLTLTGADTYTGGTDIQTGAGLVVGPAGSIGGAIADDGSLTLEHAGAFALSGAISGSGSLTEDGTGPLTLGGASSYSGGTTLEKGELIVTSGKALGMGSLTLDKGTGLLATATMALAATQTASNTMTFSGAATIAAAHGTTLSIGGAYGEFDAATLNFGAAGDDGTVVYAVTSGTVSGPLAIKVDDGTLKAGDDVLGILSGVAGSVTVASGATFNLGGFAANAQKLLGDGQVTNSTSASATLTDLDGTFAGVISGSIALVVAGPVTLTGANTFTRGTTIDSGATLQLGAGGTAGSLTGAIDDDGELAVDESGAVSLAGPISGSGEIDQEGAGTTTLSDSNAFTGGVTIRKGELVSARNGALGSGGGITISGGELLAGATQTLTRSLITSGLDTIAAATGATLTLATQSSTSFGAGTLSFGDAADTGTVVFTNTGGFTVGAPTSTMADIRYGTLEDGDGSLFYAFDELERVRVETGATLNLGGYGLELQSLAGGGTVTNTRAAADLYLYGATAFSGVIAGRYSAVYILQNATLSGDETFTGDMLIENGVDLTLKGLFGETVEFDGSGELILAAPARFTGKIAGFQSGASIDLANITDGAGATLSYKAGKLTISDGTHTDTLSFTGTYVLGNFVAASDGSGGTTISWQTPPPAAPAATPAAAPLASAMAAFGAASPPSITAAALVTRSHPVLAAPTPH